MTDKSKYIDYATVRNALENARERRGELSYEQEMALNHAMWAASTMRASVETDSKVFISLLKKLMTIEKLAAAPDIAAKIAEVIPVEGYSPWKTLKLTKSSRSFAKKLATKAECLPVIQAPHPPNFRR